MRLLYSLLLYLVTPLVLLRLAWRGTRQRGYWRGVGQRFGFAPRLPDGAAVWVHAVSVGESMAAVPLIRHLLATQAGPVLVTTTTPTGADRLRASLGDSIVLSYFPYDLPDAVARFLRRTRPRRVIVMETELWPNLFRAVSRAGIPLILANARVSPRSFARYQRLRGFTASVLSDCRAIAAQGDADAERFRALGADPQRVHAVGNLKFDVEVSAALVAQGRALRTRWGSARPVWVAASTHAGEEEAALRAHRRLLTGIPDAVLVLVPRHPQRFDAVARTVAASGLRFARRSAVGAVDAVAPPLDGIQVLLGDSMGELPMYFGAADVAFVGGSLVEVGGHNVLEPAAVGLPVLFGPCMHNFEIARDLLLDARAARQVDDALQLESALATLLRDRALRDVMGRAGREVLQANRGALERLATLIAAT